MACGAAIRAVVLSLTACSLATGIAGCGSGGAGQASASSTNSTAGGTSAATSGAGSTGTTSTATIPDNGVAAESAQGIIKSALNAAVHASSVNVSGFTMGNGARVSLNITMVPGKGASGELVQGGLDFRIIAVKQALYINANDAVWTQASHGNTGMVRLLHGRWLKVPVTDTQIVSAVQFVDPHKFFTELLASGKGTPVKGTTSTIGGQQAISVYSKNQNATLYVARTGKPYPLEITTPGKAMLVFDFDEQQPPLTAPANVVDISQLANAQSSS